MSIRYKISIAILISIFMVTASISFAYQVDTTVSRDIKPMEVQSSLYRLSIGIGVGTLDDGESASFAYNFGDQFISLRFVQTVEFNMFSPKPDESIWDISMLYGRSAQWGKWYGSVGAGIGLVHSVQRGKLLRRSDEFLGADEYESIERSVIGLPIQAEISEASFPFMGLAIIGFANINGVRSYAGLTLCLQFGKLR
jgi:hypothetical protein